MDNIFKALNDETRREILTILKQEDMNAGAIAEHFKISKPSISHHLDILKRANLISGVKKGQFVIYTINTSVLEDLLQWIVTLKSKNEKKISSKGSPLVDINRNTDNIPL